MNNIEECKILIVDDEIQLLYMVKEILLNEGFKNISTASTCKEALEKFKTEDIDIVLLDVMLPDGDGFSVLKTIREDSNIPVLFLSAKDEDYSRLLGLGLGADDYITKPFLPKELILRLKGVLKRTYFPLTNAKVNNTSIIKLENSEVDMNSGIVKSLNADRCNTETTLTAKEYAILKKLYINKGNIVTIDALCRAAWDDDNIFNYENTLMVHIRRLREKIELDPSHPKHLITVRGLGYKLIVQD